MHDVYCSYHVPCLCASLGKRSVARAFLGRDEHNIKDDHVRAARLGRTERANKLRVDISAPFRNVSIFLNSFLVDRDYLDPTARIRSGLIERIGKDPVKPIQRLQKGNDKDKRKNERRRYHFFYYRFAFHRTPPYSYLSFLTDDGILPSSVRFFCYCSSASTQTTVMSSVISFEKSKSHSPLGEGISVGRFAV